MLKRFVCCLLLGGAFFAEAFSSQAVQAADVQLKAPFDVRLAGLQIGNGNFEARFTDQNYAVGVSARVLGLMRYVAGGEGSASARGSFNGERLLPALYHISNSAGERSNEIRLLMRGSNVLNEMVIPPSYPFPDRVPLNEGSRRGVVDPLSAFVMPILAGAEPLSPQNCARTLHLFDGRQRYDIVLSYDRVEPAGTGAERIGPSLVCKADYKQIAGHRRLPPDASQGQGYSDMEAWLTPVAGTRALIVHRMQVTTSAGKLIIQAQQIDLGGASGQQAAVSE